ncbi:hypothetical protein PR202_gb18868 [Eleusine coracana subsp. coracana]|uniref:Yippee domain-containing protein n=1 Tax=Eleusine coracana subsp. coracana TaxID=191504 RepID=A0AAV5F8B4_ELECO|nr:hypothetical protein PR202_gb18868 [Eleusine coracana subsp. coracana]
MGLLFVERLEGEGIFRCRQCRVDAASKDSIISRDFYGRTGRAYLFDHVYVATPPSTSSLVLLPLVSFGGSCLFSQMIFLAQWFMLGLCPWPWWKRRLPFDSGSDWALLNLPM